MNNDLIAILEELIYDRTTMNTVAMSLNEKGNSNYFTAALVRRKLFPLLEKELTNVK